MSEFLPNSHSPKNTGGCSSAQMQELNDAKAFLKIIHDKYTKYKILNNAVEGVLEESSLDVKLQSKVQNIQLGNNCAQVTALDSNSCTIASQVLFGLTDLDKGDLNYNEAANVKKVVEESLQNEYKSINDQFFNATGENINNISSKCQDVGNFNLTNEEQALFELKRKLEEQHRKYLHNLLEDQKALEDMVNLRLETLPEICNNKVAVCEITSRMTGLQSKLVKERTRVDIFTETGHSLFAYKELMKDILDQQLECQKDIQYLEHLKEKYAQIACKQYDEILKLFIQYKSSLAKKKMIYESLVH